MQDIRGARIEKEASRIADRLPGAELKAKKGHVGHEQGMRPCTRDRLEVMVHHGEADGRRVVESEADVANVVPDKMTSTTGSAMRAATASYAVIIATRCPSSSSAATLKS